MPAKSNELGAEQILALSFLAIVAGGLLLESRWGQPEDVGNLCRFLIGTESRWITGTAINIDGGHSLRRGPDFTQFAEAMHGRAVLDGALPEK